MEQVSPLQMLWTVLLAYTATYGFGALVCLPARLRPTSGLSRLGVYCGVGAVVIGWVGYICALNGWGLAARVLVWLGAVAGAVLMAWGQRKADDTPTIPGRAVRLVLLAIVVAFIYRGAISYGQIGLSEHGLSARGLWPDLLYRQAIVKEFMTFDGFPEWPWLAGEPLKGTGPLRLSSTATILAAAGVEYDQYQLVSLWLSLYGIPVAAGGLLALLQYAGATPAIAALAVLATAFFGSPRWLMEERFAHSPSLVWAGGDVFSFVFPALYATAAIVFALISRFTGGAVAVAVVMLGSVTAFAPWFSLPLLAGILMWMIWCLIRRHKRKTALALGLGALLGLVTLKTLCGTGATGGNPLAVIGPSPVIRSMAWAFPFLTEPLSPAIAELSPLSLAKLAKFGVAYLCATVFFLLGTLWTRAVFLADWHKWDWRRVASPANVLVACIVIAGILLTSALDFRRVSYNYADYDMLRLLWIPLIFANLALADFAWRRREALRRWYGVTIAIIVVGLGAWEYSYYVLEKRAIEPAYHITTERLEPIWYLNRHAAASDTVLINPLSSPETRPEAVGHDWGYFSGLALPAVWLDNRDMAYKFAQNAEWDRRAGLLMHMMDEADATRLRSFLAQERIGWVYLERGDGFTATVEAAGLEPVFENSAGRLYHLPTTR
jgi:hypothetical protein